MAPINADKTDGAIIREGVDLGERSKATSATS
jgi:hypothetical protein